jgi:glyoxylase-like metal-dependent hydrolase (beta-lactamase superfamily II)
MTEILPGIHLVDGLSGETDFTTHVYIARDSDGSWTLIDSGMAGSETKIGEYLTAHRIAPRSIKRILITHLHADHTGGLRALVALTGARTYAHWLEASFLRKRPAYDGPGAKLPEPFEVDELLKDGDRLEAIGGVVAYHTPGHTPGHTVYHQPERKILFSGDLFFGEDDRLILTVPAFTHHTGSAQASAERVAELPVDSLLSYHGGPFPKGGHDRIAALVKRFA